MNPDGPEYSKPVLVSEPPTSPNIPPVALRVEYLSSTPNHPQPPPPHCLRHAIDLRIRDLLTVLEIIARNYYNASPQANKSRALCASPTRKETRESC
jgi:hypothetical protein